MALTPQKNYIEKNPQTKLFSNLSQLLYAPPDGAKKSLG